MFSQQASKRGFTIVELLIVIVVIGILAALVISTFSSVQVKARDTERATDVAAMVKQLEAFYAVNGYYPYTDRLLASEAATTQATVFRGLDAGAFISPTAAVGTVSSWVNYFGSITPANYTYKSFTAGGTRDTAVRCDRGVISSESLCVRYSIWYKTEAAPNDYVILDSRAGW